MRTRFTIFIILILTSCTSRFITQPDPTPVILTLPASDEIQPALTSTQGANPTMVSIPATSIVPNLESLTAKAKEDLAQRLSIPVTKINLIEAVEVEWSDSSLGCPQPDMFYLQVITPGYRIVLEASDQPYEYHSNKDAYIVYCENLVPPVLPKP